VSSVRAPASATEFTPFASQISAAKPDLLFVAWAGTTAPAMWQTLDQQGVLSSTTVVTGLDIRASWPTFGAAGAKISFLSHWFDGAADTEAAKAAKAKVPGGTLDLFHPDGFAAAQMVVRAVEQGGDDVDKMIAGLEGWSFEGVKGTMTIRAEDHALLQPMFQAKLTGSGSAYTATAQKSLTGDETAPPVGQMKG
jgi:branched-chain amino acid transport system substrate-binding protein